MSGRLSIALFALAAFCLNLGCAGDSATLTPPPSIEFSATSMTVQEGTSWQLSARGLNLPTDGVVWSIDEGDGGTVTQAGLYTAPTKLGRFHVRATSASEPTVSATIEVSVVVAGASDGFARGPWVGLGANAQRTGISPRPGLNPVGVKIRDDALGFPDPETFASPALPDGRAAYCPGGRNLYKFDLLTGREVFRCATEGVVRAAPAVGVTGMVFVGDDAGNLYGITGWGEISWKFKTNGPIQGSPLLTYHGFVIVGSGDGNLYAVDQQGKMKWVLHSGIITGSAALLDAQSICIGAFGGQFYCVDIETGHINWQRSLGDPIQTTPSIADNGTIYISTAGKVLWAYGSDGTRKWFLDLDPDFEDINGIGSPAIAPDGTVYLTTHQKYLVAVRPDGTRKWRADVPGAFPGSLAIDSDGTVYCGGTGGLHAVNQDGTTKSVTAIGSRMVGSPALNNDGLICVISASGSMVQLR